jgi:PAS domain S-box-containing protein
MTDDLYKIGLGPAYERLERLSHRAEELPEDARELVNELLEAFAVSVEELQVAGEELQQQNDELLAAQDAIQTQRRRYRDLFEFAPDGYLVTDPAGIIHDANQAAVDLLGVPKRELLDKPMVLYVAPGERDGFHRHLDRFIQRGAERRAQVEWQMRLQPRRGPAFPAALTVAPVRNPQGELSGVRWLVRDLSASERAVERERLLAAAREQREAALAANRLLQALIETMPVGAVIADAKGEVLVTNSAGRDILGSAVRGSVTRPEREYTPQYPDGSPFPYSDMPLAHALREGRTHRDVEFFIRRADGEKRNLLASAAPVLDARGQIVSAITVFQDITERKQARLALHRYNERLRALHETDQAILAARSVPEIAECALRYAPRLLDCVRTSVTLLDLEAGEMSVLAFDRADATETGAVERIPLADEAVIGLLGRGELYTVEDRQKRPRSPLLGTLCAKGVCTCIHVPLIVEEGLIGTLNLEMGGLGPLTAEQQEIARELANEVAIGIHQSRLRDALRHYADRLEGQVARRTGALQASQARFRSVFEDSVLGIALLDGERRVLASNPALQRILGYSDDELAGTNFLSYRTHDESEGDANLYEALTHGELEHYQVEISFRRKDGQTRWGNLTVSKIKRTGTDAAMSVIMMLEDITEKRLNQNALLQTERLALAGRLGASLAHEINNPLQSVIGCLGLAEEMLDDGTEVRRYLEIGMEELERAASIVTQLRDLSRESKAMQMDPTNLNELVEKVLVLTQKQCLEQGVKVQWHPLPGSPTVQLAPDRIQQVFLNLVLNAIEAMPGGGRLDVSASGVHVRFADSGVGIASGALSQIFEPFHSSRPEGLGLGLYISRMIIDEHEGRIEVDSSPGEGTTVAVWLPR